MKSLLSILSISILFSSCLKNDLPKKSINQNIVLTEKWLDSEKNGNLNHNLKIDSLKKYLYAEVVWEESIDTLNSILVIQLKKEFKLKNNKNIETSNFLVVQKDKFGVITGGYIIQYRTNNQALSNRLEPGQLKRIFNKSGYVNDCTITFLKIDDKFLFESNYKNGKLNSNVNLHNRLNSQENSQLVLSNPDNNCINWYLVTTIYFPDGSSYVYEEYVTRTCGGCSLGTPNQTDECEEVDNGENNGADPTNEMLMYTNYSSMQTLPANVIAETTNAGQTPISGIIQWNVAQATFGSWAIEAATQYSYLHYESYNITHTHWYDFTNFQTTSSYFVGSNVLIESTWTQTSLLDEVVSNNTPSVYGKSRISGTIRHRLRQPLPGNWGFVDGTYSVPGNELRFYPK